MDFLPSGLPEGNLMIAFGVLLAFGTLGGLLAARVRWLPTITGFMALGLLIGPSGIGLLSQATLDSARVLVDIALGLILFRLGSALHPWAVVRERRLLITGLVESLATFAAILALMHLLGASHVVAVLVAAIAVSSSPAVLVHVAEELHARGPTIDTAMSLVAINNVLAFVLYSVALPLALQSARVEPLTALALPAYQLLGAVAVALVVGWVATWIARQTRRNEEHLRFALVVGAVLLSLGLAVAFRVSTLFTALTLGIVCRWLQGRSRLTRVDFGGGGDVFFIILFVVAGANLHLADLALHAPAALGFVLMRCMAKAVAVYSCGRAFGFAHRQSTAVSLMLLPMAGLAIGLVQSTAGLVPELGMQVAAVVLAAVAVFETLGPPLVAYALRFAGEAKAAMPDSPSGRDGAASAETSAQTAANESTHP
ncbi:cation:proton antiporter [Rhizobacter sp. J219]|jgi:Kef-type K+ transport system membrane component KefB|uniref:cation:proton antiporter n=1 Tax=Rhizobacter sp. J219 TaxID=2898430 RepID=UPI002151A6CB|nr:cation:proton antiporter [Rhizobacter sp. J219]MCR5882870.1 cation:proton antiporter [Rhizobacter sp. J219]